MTVGYRRQRLSMFDVHRIYFDDVRRKRTRPTVGWITVDKTQTNIFLDLLDCAHLREILPNF